MSGSSWVHRTSCIVILLASWITVCLGCGGCSTCSETDAACIPTQVRTRKHVVNTGWFMNQRPTTFTRFEYYKGIPYCCSGYELQDSTCTKRVRECGGCDRDGIETQVPCEEEIQQKRVKYAIVTYPCEAWWFAKKTCSSRSSYYLLHRYTVKTCCEGYTLVGDECVKDNVTPSCGTSKYANPGVRLTHVVGGLTARPNEFPWQLRVTTNSGGSCGAALVDENWVLTVAHCVHTYIRYPIGVSVLAGDHDTGNTESTEQKRFISDIFVHPDYNGDTFENDLAVLRLRKPMELNENVRPICLPTSCSEVYEGKTMYVSGWGRTSPGPRDSPITRDNKLQFASMIVQPKRSCSIFGNTRTFLCATDGQGDTAKSPCFGDSGGPAMLKLADGRFKAIGLTSFVAARGCAKSLPSGYVDLRPYHHWIRQIIY